MSDYFWQAAETSVFFHLGRREVLVMVMRKHQRYFPVYSQGGEELLQYFITVANGLIHPPTVTAGA